MGQDAARITAANFVTPPEFEHLRLASQTAGRIGGLRLTLSADENGTHLKSRYQQIPLRAFSLESGPSFAALVYLLNPTAGILDGDAHLVHIDAQQHTRTLLVGQSASRIHPAVHSFSTQQWHITVHPGAVLVALPGPAIPYRGSRNYSLAVIDLHDNASLIWGDVCQRGRHGEPFCFERFVQEFIVRRQGRLVFRNRFSWQGPWNDDAALWHFAQQPACGSLFATGTVNAELIKHISPISPALFETAEQDTTIRWLGNTEAVTASVFQTAQLVANNLMQRSEESPCSLCGEHLASTHWFTSFEKKCFGPAT